MRNYTTQMDAARKGIVTPELKSVAEKEHMHVEELQKLVAEGKVAICANKNHKCLDPQGVGSMLRTKINVNLAVSGSRAQAYCASQSSFCLASAILSSMALAPGIPFAMSAAWAAILDAMMPCFTSSTFGSARCSAGVT